MSPGEVAAAVAAHGLAGSLWDPPREPLADEEWRAVLNTVTYQRYPGLLLDAIESERFAATPHQRDEAQEAHETSMLVALRLEQRLVAVSTALVDAGIDHRVLKGSAYAALVYPDPALRSFGDVDLLIPADRFADTVQLLEQRGYLRLWPEIHAGYDRRFGKGATLRDDEGIELDLHRTFSLGPFGLGIDAATVFANPVKFELAGTALQALEPDMMFLHACFHAALGDLPPRTLALRDVAQLLLLNDVDEVRVLDVAAEWGAECVVARAVRLSWEALRLADVTRVSSWAMHYEPTPRDQRLLDTYVGERRSHTAKSLASLRVIPGVRHKVAFLWASLFPSREFVESRSGSRAAWVRRGLGRTAKGAE